MEAQFELYTHFMPEGFSEVGESVKLKVNNGGSVVDLLASAEAYLKT